MLNHRAIQCRCGFRIPLVWKRHAIFIFLAAGMTLISAAVHGQATSPLTLDQVRNLLSISAPDATIANAIASRGIAFQPTVALLSELERDGAGDLTLAVLHKLIPSESMPSDAARENNPPKMTIEQLLATGEARWNVGDHDGAIAQYREAVRLEPNDAKAHRALGWALGWKGDWDGEIREESQTIRLDPGDAEAHYSLGVAFYKKGDWEGAIQESRQAIRIKPDFAEAHDGLGAALGCKGDWDAAIAEERTAIQLKPDLAEAHEWLGLWLGNKGDVMGEVTEEREAIRLKPDFAEAHEVLGWGLEHAGDIQAALAEYRRALELKPEFAMAQSQYDRLLKEMNRLPK